MIEVQVYGYHISCWDLGVNFYVFDDDKPIKSGFKFIKLPGVPLLPPFATFRTTVEPEIIEIQVYGYHTLLGSNSYAFDNEKSIKVVSSLSNIRCATFTIALFATFTFRTTAELKIITIQIYGKNTLSGPIGHSNCLIRVSE